MKQDFKTVIGELSVAVCFAGLLALGLAGCNNSDTRIVVEPGEPIVIDDNLSLECGVPFDLTAFSLGDSNVTYNGEELLSEFGMDLKFTVVTPCIIVDENVTEPIVPVDGKCPEGYKVTDCNTCVVLPPLSCGEGTIEDNETNTCIVAPEEVHPCGEDTEWNDETELCEIPVVEIEDEEE